MPIQTPKGRKRWISKSRLAYRNTNGPKKWVVVHAKRKKNIYQMPLRFDQGLLRTGSQKLQTSPCESDDLTLTIVRILLIGLNVLVGD
jgi:hypothetical protein